MSPNPYGRTFEEPLNLRKFDLSKHPTAGLRFNAKDGRLILTSMDTSSPGDRIDKWRSRIRGAWLVLIGDTAVSTLAEAQSAIRLLSENKAHLCLLTFTHPEFAPDISYNGLPIISRDDFSQLTHDQLNNRLIRTTVPQGTKILYSRIRGRPTIRHTCHASHEGTTPETRRLDRLAKLGVPSTQPILGSRVSWHAHRSRSE